MLIIQSNFLLNAQTFKIEGKVVDDETQNPLEFANASLLNASDSALLGGSTTDAAGKFEIQTKPGKYIVKVQ
ncbi:MAG TPA: hypothetical protein DIS90_09380, partial [Cytophagales bacterium]|nr:hypothetical protein [Cytophagales bacterium]